MKSHIRVIMAAALAGLSASAIAAEPAPLQFTDLGGVRSWKSGGDTTVFVKSKSDQWYRADMRETCMKYDTSKGINFITELDPETNHKVSKVIVERRICVVTSLKKVDSPDVK
ncbi:MAG: hypothetical protein K2P94_02470 [Rhodospirillaceae bacterium]|nr:hypothetical protein [Rhodospirillaceae bacterium]